MQIYANEIIVPLNVCICGCHSKRPLLSIPLLLDNDTIYLRMQCVKCEL